MNGTSRPEAVLLYPGGFYGGGQNVVAELARSLASGGWGITILAAPGNPLLERDLMPDIHVIAMSFPLLRDCNPFGLARSYRRLRRFAHDHGRAVFYGHSFQSMKYLAWISGVVGGRTVLHLHESDCRMYHSWRARALSRRVHSTIAISKFVKGEFVAGTQVAESTVEVVPNGITIAPAPDKSPGERLRVRNELGIGVECPVVTMVARADPGKGHLVLVQAAEQVLKSVPGTVFLLIGMSNNTVSERHTSVEVAARIASHNLQNQVKVLGFREDARRIVRHSDIAVVPSTLEGFGLTAIEALAEQTPLIASRVGGLAEIFSDEQEGLYVEPNNPEALSRALLRLLNDKELGKTLSARGRTLAMQRYSMPEMTRRVSTILQRTLDHGRTEPS